MSTHHQHQAQLQGHGSAITTPVGETLVSPGLTSPTEPFHYFPSVACAKPADKAVCDFFDFSRHHSCPFAVPTLSSDLN